MESPDPWFGETFKDKSRFVPEPCSFVEIWHHESGQISTRIDTLKPDQIEGWVNENGIAWKRPVGSIGGLRLLLASAEVKKFEQLHLSLSQATFNMLFSEFDLLTTVLHAWITGNRVLVCCKSQLASRGILSWMLRQFEHGASLSYCAKTNTVKGVVFADQTRLKVVGKSCLAFKEYACHPMLVPLIILAHEMDRLVCVRKMDNEGTLELEHKIGLRWGLTADENFLSQTETAMRHTLERLTMITNHRADTEIMDRLMDKITSGIGLINEQVLSMPHRASRERLTRQSLDLEYLVEYLRQSNTSIAASFGALQKRVEIQMSALYTILGQRDSKLNLEMAHDSRRLASASRRDSSSMKTIAVLTTVFLPGTFIATIFSMSMVDYAPSQFWIYLAIAIPLTVVVLTVWAAWMLWIDRRNENEAREAQGRLPRYGEQEGDPLEDHSVLTRMKRVLCQK